jgi:hypothetical protein
MSGIRAGALSLSGKRTSSASPGTRPRLSLAGAVDALTRAARQGGRPGSIWIVGLFYQGLSLGWTFGFTVARPIVVAVLPEATLHRLEGFSPPAFVRNHLDPLDLWGPVHGAGDVVRILFLLLVLLIPFRLVAGLARLAPPEIWTSARERSRGPSFVQAWRYGATFTRSALGLWIQVLWMMFLAALFFLGPCHVLLMRLGLADDSPWRALLYGLTIGLIAVYGFVLAVLFQLALHSLVQNRRGVGSALLHAWRIARNDPQAAGRAAAVDGLLYLVVLAFQAGLLLLTTLATNLVELAGMKGAVLLVGLPGVLLVLVLEAFAGCTRCAYWAQTYRSLGGISTV